MKTKRNTPSRIPDVLIVLICLTGIIISLWMFWNDVNTTLTKQSETPVGRIEFKRKYAQRRFTDSVVWDRLQQSSPVYNGDTIRTASLSLANITFEGRKDRIQLNDNSIIQIWVDKDGGARIDLSGGNIAIDTQDDSGSFTLVSGTNEITVGAGSRVNVQSGTSGEDINVTVTAGSASLTSGQGTMTMDAGSALKVSRDGTTESFVSVVDIIPYPDTYASVSSPNNIPVQFVWNAAGLAAGEHVRLEIARDKAFTAVKHSVDVSSGNNTVLTLDGAAAYYWRIYPVDAENDAGRMENVSMGKIDLAYSQAPELISPAEGYTYRYRTKNPAVHMYWASQNPDAWYQVEIADNPQMNNSEVTLVQESFMTNSAFGAGDWYWRVTPVYPNGFLVNNAPSRTGHFTIEQDGGLKAPELLVPASGTVINITNERSSAFFSWKNDPEAASYTIQISASANLENPIISHDVTHNFYSYAVSQHVLKPGQYYWAVYQTDAEGNKSSVSESRSFLTAVEEEEEMEDTTISPTDNYAAADSQAGDIVSPLESSTEPDDNTPPLSTDSKSFRIVPPLEAPRIISPEPEASLTLRPGTSFDFSWEAVEEADYYQFKLYRGNRLVFENLSVRASSQSYFMDRLQPGEYRWTVQAFIAEDSDAVKRDSLIASSTLSVKRLQPVRLDYPALGRSYEGLAALNNPDSVRWSSVEPVGSSRFILSTSADPLSNPRSIIVDTRNPDNTVKLPPLREGTYYWTIIAQTRDGINISAERPSSFKVLPIPLLPAVRASAPQNNLVIGIDELAALGGIDFAWQPVQEADRYIFSLHARNSSGSLTRVIGDQILSETSYAFRDLSLIDDGTYVWRVEAQSLKNDGTVDRRGDSAEFTFVIHLPETGTIETYDPGTLYGR